AGSAGPVTVGARAEHLLLSPPRGAPAIRGVATVIERLGSDTFVHLRVDGVENPVIVRQVGDDVIAPGTTLDIGFDPVTLHVFGEDGKRLESATQERTAA
ncbi:MAG: TOBE domain-containing protein, partial [Proteobacteria bacterium]|nr:TOBE domain-containing protein [Pseudomonadota bacterium]